MNYTEIGRKIGKSDKAVRKMCIAYNLPYRSKDLKQFRIDNDCYIPTKSELRKTKEERYVHYEINGEKKNSQRLEFISWFRRKKNWSICKQTFI